MCSYLSDDVSQAGVTQQQPAARSDAVSFILKLLRIHFMEVFKPAAETSLNDVQTTNTESLKI